MDVERRQTIQAIVRKLHCFLYNSQELFFMTLLDHYAASDRRLLTSVRYNGITALFYAAITNNTIIIKYLITHCKCLIDQRCYFYNSERVTPFWAAVVKGNCKAANMLLAFGANINARGWWGSTALIKALVEKNLLMARILLSYEANIDACTNERKTALMAATFDIDVTKELLSRSKYSLRQRDIFGNTALHHAIQNKHMEVASLLVKSGIDPLTPNHKGVDSLTLVKESRKKLMGVPPVCRRLQFDSFSERMSKTNNQYIDLYYFDPEEHDCPDRDSCGDWDFVDCNPLKDLPGLHPNLLQAAYYRK